MQPKKYHVPTQLMAFSSIDTNTGVITMTGPDAAGVLEQLLANGQIVQANPQTSPPESACQGETDRTPQ